MLIGRKWTPSTYSKSGSFFHHFVANNRYSYARHVCKPTRLQGCRWRWYCRAATSTSRMSGRWGWHGYSCLVAAARHSSYIMLIKFQWHRHCICRYRSCITLCRLSNINRYNKHMSFQTTTEQGLNALSICQKLFYRVLEIMVMVHLTNSLWLWIGCCSFTRSPLGSLWYILQYCGVFPRDRYRIHQPTLWFLRS